MPKNKIRFVSWGKWKIHKKNPESFQILTLQYKCFRKVSYFCSLPMYLQWTSLLLVQSLAARWLRLRHYKRAGRCCFVVCATQRRFWIILGGVIYKQNFSPAIQFVLEFFGSTSVINFALLTLTIFPGCWFPIVQFCLSFEIIYDRSILFSFRKIIYDRVVVEPSQILKN